MPSLTGNPCRLLFDGNVLPSFARYHCRRSKKSTIFLQLSDHLLFRNGGAWRMLVLLIPFSAACTYSDEIP
jgi:hypothetical protein